MVSGADSSFHPRRRRLFVLDFKLTEPIGHYLNFVTGFVRAAEERGIPAMVLVPANASPAVVEALSAAPVLPAVPRRIVFANDRLEELPTARAMLADAWREIERSGITRDDIVLFAEPSVVALFDLPRWLSGLPAEARPAIFVRFLGSEIRVSAGDRFRRLAQHHRFLARLLLDAPGGDRVFYTINTQSEVPLLAGIAKRRAFFMPMPKFYGDPAIAPSGEMTGRLLRVHVNVRIKEEEEGAIRLARSLLEARHDLFVVLKFGKFADASVSERLAGPRLTSVTGGQSTADYLAMMHASDVVVLPYGPAPSRGTNSGVFCEAAAFGKVVVAPAGTWMAEQLVAGHAAGVLFDAADATAMTRASLSAIERFPTLSAAARERAGRFRTENSCAGNLDRMVELASGSHDMNIDTLIDGGVDFTAAFPSRQHLVSGWGRTLPGEGVSMVGGEASLIFRLAHDGRAPLGLLAEISCEIGEEPPPNIALSINGRNIAWQSRRIESDAWLFEAAVPPGVVSATEADVRFVRSGAARSPDGEKPRILLRKLTFSTVSPSGS